MNVYPRLFVYIFLSTFVCVRMFHAGWNSNWVFKMKLLGSNFTVRYHIANSQCLKIYLTVTYISHSKFHRGENIEDCSERNVGQKYEYLIMYKVD